jgi:predicted AlkP superfamily pyrophosphatase or phosphodiesterase
MGLRREALSMRYFAAVPFILLATTGLAMAAPPTKPTLLVTIVVDQYSADLFGEYRSLYKDGLATLAQGAVFPHGFQSHSGTETCPGHSTILTGARPGRTGIIANEWQDPKRPRQEGGKQTFAWYCVDELDAQGNKIVSSKPLRVPTLGDRLHAADPSSRTVAIAGKDRAAVMLGGHDSYLTLWWAAGKGFVTYPDAQVDVGMRKKIDQVNKDVKTSYESTQRPKLPQQCKGRSRAVNITDNIHVGELHDIKARSGQWRTTPALDTLTLEMAKAAIDTLQLGKRKSVDVLAVSFSVTDYVGHYFGTEGAEMCAQQLALDATIKGLLKHLDATGVSYVVALTADHGGLDIPERNKPRSVVAAQRLAARLAPQNVGAAVAQELHLPGSVLLGSYFTNDVYLSPSIDSSLRPMVLDAVRRRYESDTQVATVFTRNELLAAEPPSGPPDQWTLLERAKASFNPERSGDLVVLLKPYVTLYGVPEDADKDYIASHGSAWDYDRRVPILFWWRGIEGFEQPAAVETVDIAPTLADLVGLKVAPHEMDGRVLQVGQAAK